MHELTVSLPEKSYPIYIQNGLINNLAIEIKSIYKNKKIAIITDSNVERLYGQTIENSLVKENFSIKKIIIEPGEKSKSFSVLQHICDEILDFGLNRGDLIITFGGGVVGDLGGFAASVILRGIQFIQIPTSLLAQIDSTIGGKVAVNSSRGTNLIGSFYHPMAVFIDPSLLMTLEDRYLYDGMAEVIKYGAIKDRVLFNNLMGYTTKKDLFEHIEEIIYTCCSIKKKFVEKDERDTGDRMMLNFGHTIGHGIEKYFEYERFTHGEAVAIGMHAITERSENMGITKKGTSILLKQILDKYNLPSKLPDMEKDVLMKAIGLDKKNTGKDMHVVLLEDIGNGFIKKISASELNRYIRE